mgnify:CR=1 FL=1
MRINAHTHGMHAERNADGKLVPPLMPAWRPGQGQAPVEAIIKTHRSQGIEQVIALDPPDICFELRKSFGDFVIAAPQVRMDESSPQEIADIMAQGAVGIKFIAPMRSYGDRAYFPLYETVRNLRGLAIFHTGYLGRGLFEPGCVLGRPDYVDITHMRPASLDRISRAFPDLKIIMAHFGNPWWEEAWTVLKSCPNIYAELSGGTAYRKPMSMWTNLFAANGVLHTDSVSRLCFANDGEVVTTDPNYYAKIIDFHERLYDALKLPDEIRRRIDRENILRLMKR